MKNTKRSSEPVLTKGLVSRNDALNLAPAYVRFVEVGDIDCEEIFSKFETLRKGQKVLTAFRQGDALVYVRAKVSSLVHDDPRAVDGPIVRVSNGEYSWRVDGDKYAWPI